MRTTSSQPRRLASDKPTVLAVGAHALVVAFCDEAASRHDSIHPPLELTFVSTARQAFGLMRSASFELVVVGPELSDMCAWEFTAKMRTAWPWRKWAFVAHEIEPEQELSARRLGALAVLEGKSALEEVRALCAQANRVRRLQSGVASRVGAAAIATLSDLSLPKTDNASGFGKTPV